MKHQDSKLNRVSSNVESVLNKEFSAGMKDISYYQDFQDKANKVKYKLLSFLLTQKEDGKKVVAYGAAAKGNTLLNYCGIKKDMIEFVVDASPHKQGKFLPGSHLAVVEEAIIRKLRPEYIIILPWNIKDEVTEQLTYIREWGGKFVIAVPDILIF